MTSLLKVFIISGRYNLFLLSTSLPNSSAKYITLPKSSILIPVEISCVKYAFSYLRISKAMRNTDPRTPSNLTLQNLREARLHQLYILDITAYEIKNMIDNWLLFAKCGPHPLFNPLALATPNKLDSECTIEKIGGRKGKS